MLLERAFQADFTNAAALATGPICLAVSGGGDSMALLACAADWARDAGRTLRVLTVDHDLRPEAAEEARRVGAVADRLGLPYDILRWTDPSPSQSRARRARHALLADRAGALGSGLILTGHTADDDVETFLMRARRGSTWRGLAGMGRAAVSPVWPEGRGVLVARPLLGARRRSLREMLAMRDIDWIEDPSNDDEAYERVRWRGKLEDEPALSTRVLKAIAGLKALRRLESRTIARWMNAFVAAKADGSLRADPRGLTRDALEPALGLLVQIAAGTDRPPDRQRLAALANDIASGGPGKARTLGGAWIARDGENLVLARDPGLLEPSEGNVWDNRFIREDSASPVAVSTAMAAKALPPGEGGWRALAGDRLALTIRALAAW